MLTITVLGEERFDEANEVFVYPDSVELQLEHSLVSLSKWESEFEKPFLAKEEKTPEEVLGYIKAMIVTPNVPDEVIYRLSEKNVQEINNYIDSKQSATWFNEVGPEKKSSETITSELIYYWMSAFNIPIECESWHLSRLFNLIRICNIKSQPPNKMGNTDAATMQRELNARRRAQMGTRG